MNEWTHEDWEMEYLEGFSRVESIYDLPLASTKGTRLFVEDCEVMFVFDGERWQCDKRNLHEFIFDNGGSYHE